MVIVATVERFGAVLLAGADSIPVRYGNRAAARIRAAELATETGGPWRMIEIPRIRGFMVGIVSEDASAASGARS